MVPVVIRMSISGSFHTGELCGGLVGVWEASGSAELQLHRLVGSWEFGNSAVSTLSLYSWRSYEEMGLHGVGAAEVKQ